MSERFTPERFEEVARAHYDSGLGPMCLQAAHDARVVEAVRAFLVVYDTVEPAIVSAFHMSQIHGMPYRGPTYGKELEALRAAVQA